MEHIDKSYSEFNTLQITIIINLREKAKDMLKFLYRVNDERTREMFDIMVANDKNNKQIREKIVNDIIDDFDRIQHSILKNKKSFILKKKKK